MGNIVFGPEGRTESTLLYDNEHKCYVGLYGAVMPPAKFGDSFVNPVDKAMFACGELKNKYPQTRLYRMLTTSAGIMLQLNEQENNENIFINYLVEFNSAGILVWEIKEVQVTRDDIASSVFIKCFTEFEKLSLKR